MHASSTIYFHGMTEDKAKKLADVFDTAIVTSLDGVTRWVKIEIDTTSIIAFLEETPKTEDKP